MGLEDNVRRNSHHARFKFLSSSHRKVHRWYEDVSQKFFGNL